MFNTKSSAPDSSSQSLVKSNPQNLFTKFSGLVTNCREKGPSAALVAFFKAYAMQKAQVVFSNNAGPVKGPSVLK